MTSSIAEPNAAGPEFHAAAIAPYAICERMWISFDVMTASSLCSGIAALRVWMVPRFDPFTSVSPAHDGGRSARGSPCRVACAPGRGTSLEHRPPGTSFCASPYRVLYQPFRSVSPTPAMRNLRCDALVERVAVRSVRLRRSHDVRPRRAWPRECGASDLCSLATLLHLLRTCKCNTAASAFDAPRVPVRAHVDGHERGLVGPRHAQSGAWP